MGKLNLEKIFWYMELIGLLVAGIGTFIAIMTGIKLDWAGLIVLLLILIAMELELIRKKYKNEAENEN